MKWHVAHLYKIRIIFKHTVILDVAQPTKVFRTFNLRTLVGHFLESIICDLEQNVWWGIGSNSVAVLSNLPIPLPSLSQQKNGGIF